MTQDETLGAMLARRGFGRRGLIAGVRLSPVGPGTAAGLKRQKGRQHDQQQGASGFPIGFHHSFVFHPVGRTVKACVDSV